MRRSVDLNSRQRRPKERRVYVFHELVPGGRRNEFLRYTACGHVSFGHNARLLNRGQLVKLYYSSPSENRIAQRGNSIFANSNLVVDDGVYLRSYDYANLMVKDVWIHSNYGRCFQLIPEAKHDLDD